MGVKADFSGYATKAGLKCTDGRTIMPDAFKHMDGKKVPLVWAHSHGEPANVLGHAMLEARDGHLYAHGFFNNTPAAKASKELVEHGDIDSLSIYANQLVERAKSVLHGMVRELSLVLSGANEGAKIDHVSLRHSDGSIDELDDEAVIFTGLKLAHAGSTSADDDDDDDDFDEDGNLIEDDEDDDEDDDDDAVEHAAGEETVQDVYDSLTDVQKNVVQYMLGVAVKGVPSDSAAHSDGNDEGDDLTHQEGNNADMSRNVFERDGAGSNKAGKTATLSHSDVQSIILRGAKLGSLRDAAEEYALAHGVTNIAVLFPDAKNIDDVPQLDKRRTEWVANVLNNTRHTPFSRVKTIIADITMESARALGYIKGSLKKEEWFSVSKRTTGPTTVYKKQKLDRDDILDITDFDIVSFMKTEMRLMLEEELARAILLGDGRQGGDPDKILDPLGVSSGNGIRSILNDHELYVSTLTVNIADSLSDYNEVVEEVIRGRRFYKGTGTPTFYTTLQTMTEMLLSKDLQGRRRWKNKEELASDMMVQDIIPVEVMEDQVAYPNLLGIIVNLQDYNIGADKGGEVNLFDFFDIDFNQEKYLIETRISGALTKIRSAQVIRTTAIGNVLVAHLTDPTFVAATGVVTIPTLTGVVYKNFDTSATLSAGAQTALLSGATLNVIATPASGYYFESNQEDQWSFTRP